MQQHYLRSENKSSDAKHNGTVVSEITFSTFRITRGNEAITAFTFQTENYMHPKLENFKRRHFFQRN